MPDDPEQGERTAGSAGNAVAPDSKSVARSNARRQRRHPGTNASSWFAASWVLGYTMLAGAINVVLITALATVGAVVYSLVTHLAGGIEVVLKETG